MKNNINLGSGYTVQLRPGAKLGLVFSQPSERNDMKPPVRRKMYPEPHLSPSQTLALTQVEAIFIISVPL